LTAGTCACAIPPHALIPCCAPHRPKTGEEGEDDDDDEDEDESEEESSEDEAPAAGPASAAAPAKKPELSREERRAQKKQAKAKPGAGADEGENSDGEVLEANANRTGARGMKLSAIADAAPSRRDRCVPPASPLT
jgi:hypothetical protein